jgi:hypothetical protein
MYVSSADSPRVPPEPSPPAPRAVVTGVGQAFSFTDLLRTIGHDLDSGERGMTAAIRAAVGRPDLGPGELIALQVGVYRYSDAIDLASRLVDRAASAVKTVLQGSSP